MMKPYANNDSAAITARALAKIRLRHGRWNLATLNRWIYLRRRVD